MPGLFGVIDAEKPVEPAVVRAMQERLAYEDTYSSEIFFSPHCAIGITAPHFPGGACARVVYSRDRNLCVLMYGEIFNRDDMEHELRQKGIEKTAQLDDAEIALLLFESCGTDYIPRVNGSFVLVVFDARKQMLTLANDSMSMRALYYSHAGRKVVFASELKAVLCDPSVPREMNPAAVADFFQFGFVQGERTFVRAIDLMPPGSIMTVKGGQVSIRGYYTFPFPEEDSRRSTADYVEELHEVFGRAIGRQTREPVRFGAALSGGFDSRIVTATMLRKIKAEHVSAFTYGNDENHDTLLSKCVAGELGLDHHMVTYSLDDFVSGFAPTVWLTEGLINMPEYYYMGKAMRSRVQMGFSGHGADDLTGRYTRRAYIHNARTLEETKKSIFTHYSSRMGVLRIEPERFYSPDYYRLVKGSVVDYFEESVKPFEHYPFPSIQLYHNIRHRMLRDLTRINDVPGFFVRYRHLFYDREILDFWFRVPFRMRLDFKLYRSYLITKYPRLARIRFQGRRIPVHYWGILRPYYTFRTKAGKMAVRYGKQLGQCVPEVIRRDINTTAYRGPLKPLVRLLVLDGNRRHGMFNHDYLEAKLNDHFSSRADNHFLIHKLLTLELFQNLFLEKNVTGYRLGQPLGEIGTAA